MPSHVGTNPRFGQLLHMLQRTLVHACLCTLVPSAVRWYVSSSPTQFTSCWVLWHD